MGVALTKLYATNTGDETGKILLSGWIPEKRGEAYFRPSGAHWFDELWIPNVLDLTYEEGPVPVEVAPSDTETGIWLICVNDYFGDEDHIYTIKPVPKKVSESYRFSDWVFPDTTNDVDDDNGGFGLHISSPLLKTKAGDGPIPVTLVRKEKEI